MKFLIHTYGCQMNVRDSEAVEALLVQAGHEKVATEAEAELVIVNSCTVRQKAEEKAVGKAGNLIADGKIVGIDIDLAQAIADILKMELAVQDIAFDSIVTSVQTGKADIGVAGLTVTEDRLENVDFTEPYTTSTQVIIVRAK